MAEPNGAFYSAERLSALARKHARLARKLKVQWTVSIASVNTFAAALEAARWQQWQAYWAKVAGLGGDNG